MPFSKLLSGEVIPDHFFLKFSGIDDGIAIDSLGWILSLGTNELRFQQNNRSKSGSYGHCVGVPENGGSAPGSTPLTVVHI